MLGRVLVTFLQGAVICLGVPFLLRLCTNLFGSSFIGFIKLRIWKCEVSDKVAEQKQSDSEAETGHVLRTDLVRCIRLRSGNTFSAALIQEYCGLVPDHSSGMQYIVKSSLMDITKSENSHRENSSSLLLHNAKNNPLRIITSFPYKKLQGLYDHFNQDPSDRHEKCCWNLEKMSNCILGDTHSINSELMIEHNFSVQTFEKIHSPREISDMDGLVSMRDCVYNQKGQLVSMFICFDTVHSDSSSEVSSSDSDCDTWDSDCCGEDFIVFDSSCPDESDHCTRLDFVCDAGDMPKENCAASLVLTSNLYCNVSVMESFDSTLDSFVHQILQPNLCYGCDEYIIMDTETCKHVEHESSEDFISRDTSSKTVSKQKRKKKVHFKPDDELATVYPMVVWNFAYKQARKGRWEADALDRLRFQRRIEELDKILTPVLLAKLEKVVES